MLTDCRLTDMLLLKNVGTRAVLGLLYVTVVPLGSQYRSGTRNRAGGENLQPHHRAFRGRQREKYKSETHALSVTP